MAHPIVIMSYDKSPAITKAVAALEEAGLEVVVLNTATAKLVNFLGALAGEDQEEDEPETPPEDKTEEEPPVESAPEDVPPEEEPEEALPKDDDKVEEALVNGEKVIIERVDGDELVLHPSQISVSNRTVYKLNESDYSFWPDINETAVVGNVELEWLGEKHLVKVIFSDEAMNPPVLKVGKEWVNKIDK